MATMVDITADVGVDVDTRRAYPLFLNGPPEAEGDTCGLFFAGEEGADGFVENISIGPYVATAITLGAGDWSNGLVDLAEDTTVDDAIRLINEAAEDLQLQIDNFQSGPSSGFALPLGPVFTTGDGSWTPGAVPLTDDTSVSEAVDRLNEVLAKLVPSPPSAFPVGSLSVANSVGSSPRLANGATDNSGGGSGYVAGSAVSRITAAGFSSNTFNDVGPGESGTLTALVNGVTVATHTLTGTGDNGVYSGLVISDQKDYPVLTPGFWKSIDVALTLITAPVGINKVKINHSGAGSTADVYFVRDDVTAAPAVTLGTVAQAGAGSVAYSSSIPHYNTGATLSVEFAISNLSGQTYYGGADPMVLSGNPIANKTISYTQMGISDPVDANVTAQVLMNPQTVAIDGTGHTAGKISGQARNVNGASSLTDLNGPTIQIMRGSAGAKIDEQSVTVSGLGSLPSSSNAVRVGLGSGDKPVGAATAWTSSASLAAYEAAVAAGVLKHDQTNYSTGYLPVGPNLSSGRSGAQYVTFSFKRSSLSAFKINVTGTYAGCWIALPGVSDAQPNGGGWWDAFQPYDGAGVPGETGDTVAGCALGTVMSGASGAFQITFGTESSTHATDNEILVRFKLTSGQSITALSFTN